MGNMASKPALTTRLKSSTKCGLLQLICILLKSLACPFRLVSELGVWAISRLSSLRRVFRFEAGNPHKPRRGFRVWPGRARNSPLRPQRPYARHPFRRAKVAQQDALAEANLGGRLSMESANSGSEPRRDSNCCRICCVASGSPERSPTSFAGSRPQSWCACRRGL